MKKSNEKTGDVLNNRIDFTMLVVANNSLLNGDPLNENMPRIDINGYGEVTAVCIKRKIKDRLLEMGHAILGQGNYHSMKDEFPSISARIKGVLGDNALKNSKELVSKSCETWIDVRAFGQTFALKKQDDETSGVSTCIRGPMTINEGRTVCVVTPMTKQIVKSYNSDGDGSKKGSDTMGRYHTVEHGLYVINGSINEFLASKTGLTEDDVEAIKQAILHIFDNDESTSRPAGSVELAKLVWWVHNDKTKSYSRSKMFSAVEITPTVDVPKGIGDYEIAVKKIDNIEPEVHDFILR